MLKGRWRNSYSLSKRDLAVFSQAKVGFNEFSKVSPKLCNLPPLWSKIPYVMLMNPYQETTKYFWKAYRELNELLRTRDSHYKQAYIPKASGGVRTLLVPDGYLRRHQKNILKNVLYHIKVSDHACAYHKRRGLVDLAKPHVGHEILIHIDIKDFFSSITEQMVYECLIEETGYPKTTAGYLSRLCCYKRYLPQGACTSPALSNICFKKCDQRIESLALQNNLTYTRYSDDIYLSGDKVDSAEIIGAVVGILGEYGFQVNLEKTKVLRQNQAQKVTGIVVNEKMQASRDYRRKLRQEMYYFKRFGVNSRGIQTGEYPEYLYRLQGKLAYVLYIDPNNEEFKYYKDYVDRAIDRYHDRSTFEIKW